MLLFLKLLLTVLLLHRSVGNNDHSISRQEELLSDQYSELMKLPPEKRGKPSDMFYESFLRCLNNDSSFNFPFASLTNIGKIYSDDNMVRIYSWNIPVNLNENSYYGVIQYYSKAQKKFLLYPLNKTDSNIVVPQWQGSLYYRIIPTRQGNRRFYTLLGFDLNDLLSNKKVVEVISFDENDKLVFCTDRIRNNQSLTARLVFEYNEKAVMSLQYDEKMKMIVFDHLSPSRPSMTGHYEYYGPDFTYDGLKWEDGVWNYYEKIDVTN